MVGPRPEHPLPRTHMPENTAAPAAAAGATCGMPGLGRRGQEWSEKAIPKGEGLQFLEKRKGIRSFLGFSNFFIKTFF